MSTEQFAKYKQINPNPIELIGLNTQPYKHINKDAEYEVLEESGKIQEVQLTEMKTESSFTHLHLHSQFSVLQATPNIDKLVQKAVDENMPAVAITDHNNMFAAFKFTNAVLNHEVNNNLKEGDEPKLKAILGCELNVCKNHKDKSIQDNGAQVPFLAKNKNGYHNLSKLSSLAFLDGFYYLPRVDKELIAKYNENLVTLTGGLYGPIPHLILNVGEKQAEEEFKWWYEQFGDDFYVEIIRHDLEEEKHVNKVLLQFAKKFSVKIIASNNIYYLEKEDANAHDILLCVKDGEKQSTPIGKGRDLRYGFPNQEFYFKSSSQMQELFADLPEAIENISELVAKIESYSLKREVLLPAFNIPDSFLETLSKKEKEDGENV